MKICFRNRLDQILVRPNLSLAPLHPTTVFKSFIHLHPDFVEKWSREIILKCNRTDQFAILSVVLGLTKIFGFYTGAWFIISLSYTVAIAPAPSAFTNTVQIPPSQLDRSPAFACETKTGPLVWHQWDYHFRSTIPGPHRRTVMFVNYIGFAAKNNRQWMTQQVFDQMNRYYVCNDGPLAQVAQCGPDVVAAQFRWNNFKAGPQSYRYTREACLP